MIRRFGLGVLLAAMTWLIGASDAQAWYRYRYGGGGTVSPRYSVLDSEGHNLIVTDNQTNTLYFYTIDKDAKIGSEMKLRGSVDLTQVGRPVIRPKHAMPHEDKSK